MTEEPDPVQVTENIPEAPSPYIGEIIHHTGQSNQFIPINKDKNHYGVKLDAENMDPQMREQ